jgi:hypothetical protein
VSNPSDRRTWVKPPEDMVKNDPVISSLVSIRNQASETIASANKSLSFRMCELDPDNQPVPIAPLTKHQTTCLDWIIAFFQENGFAPTSNELCLDIGLKNTNSGDSVINSLVSKGFLRKDSHRWRGIVPLFTSNRTKFNH